MKFLSASENKVSETTTATVAEKVADKIAGALERLVDARMLILGLSFFIYLDIWLVASGLDPNKMTFDDGLGKLKLLSMGSAAIFVVSYSLLMSATIPAIRMVYTALMMYFGSDRIRPRQSAEEKQLSNWSLGVLVFTAWDYLEGHFQHGSYQGVVAYLCERFAGDGFTIAVFRVSSALFFLLCVALAFERDG